MKPVLLKADRERFLKFDINAIIRFEEIAGKGIQDMNQSSLKDLRTMMYCGLCWEDKSLTEEEAGTIMQEVLQEYGMEYLGGRIEKAIQEGFGKLTEATETDVKKK